LIFTWLTFDNFYKLKDEIEKIICEIEELKSLYERGGFQEFGPNLPDKLLLSYYKLYLYVNLNYLVYDKFTQYKTLTEKMFIGLLTSYQTIEFGITSFNEFILTEAILHIRPRSLQESLKQVDEIKINSGCLSGLLTKLNNFTSSYYKVGPFGQPFKNSLIEEYLNNHRFKDTFTDIFSNIFTILSKLVITKEEFRPSKKSLLEFLKIETELAWYDIKEFSKFLLIKGDLFEPHELIEISKIAIEGDKYGYNKYTHLIEDAAKAIHKFYPNFKIDNSKLIKTAILKCSNDDGSNANYLHLIPLITICDYICMQILIDTFEAELDREFNYSLYEALIGKTSYDWSSKNYFQLYSEYVNRSKGGRAYTYGKLKLTDLVFFHYAYLVYKLNIAFDRVELKSFTNLNSFESWLLNPFGFNYDSFEVNWLTDINNPIFLNRLKSISKIKSAIEAELDISFDATLAEIRYKYFLKN